MQLKPNKHLTLSIQCCQNCFEHPPSQYHPQSQSIYSTALIQLQSQLMRCLYECQVTINKNQGNNKPRLGAFQVKFKGLLVFSKITHRKFGKCCDLVNIVLALQHKNKYQLHKIINKLGTQDLYGWLRQKTQTVKLSYKFISDQIDKIVKVDIVELKTAIKRLNSTKSIAQKQNIQLCPSRRNLQSSLSCRNPISVTRIPDSQTNRVQTASASSRKLKNPPISALTKKILSQASERVVCETQGDVQIIPKSNSKRKRTQNTVIRNSMRQSKFGSRVSTFELPKEEKIGKYSYLSKQMDGNHDAHGNKGSEGTIAMHSQKYNFRKDKISHEQQQNFQILSLSDSSSQYGDNHKIWDEDKLLQRKIQQGLNFNLTATYNQKRSSHRCSFQYKKLAQMLQLQLKQDEQQPQQKIHPKSTDSILQIGPTSSNQLSNKQSLSCSSGEKQYNLRASFPESMIGSNSSIQKEDLLGTPSVYVITEKDLLSRRHITWIHDQQEQREEEVGQLSDTNCIKSEDILIASQPKILSNTNQEQQQPVQISELRKQTIQQHQHNLNILIMDQLQKQSQQIIELNKKIQPIISYQQNYVNPLIAGLSNSREQISINTSSNNNTQLSVIVSYINNKFPKLLPALFNSQNAFHNLQILNNDKNNELNPRIHKLCLFDQKYGNLSNNYIKSTGYQPWQNILCNTISQILNNQQSQQKQQWRVYQVLRVITGAPVVRISGVDLRKIKRIVVDGHFKVQKDKRKGIVIGVQDNGWQFCQIIDIKKNNKDILQSVVTYLPITQNHNKNEQISKIYEQFVLEYQHLAMWLVNPAFYHNQTTIINQIICNSPTIKYWKLYLNLKHVTQLFFEFTEHKKQQKINRILICKLESDKNDENVILEVEKMKISQTIGELNKKGNFFFQLTLESGLYFLQIQRQFMHQESNTVHLYSSQPIEIMKSFIQ